MAAEEVRAWDAGAEGGPELPLAVSIRSPLLPEFPEAPLSRGARGPRSEGPLLQDLSVGDSARGGEEPAAATAHPEEALAAKELDAAAGGQLGPRRR